MAVPELQTIAFGGSVSFFSYHFAYFTDPSNDTIPVQKQGALQAITLPTGGVDPLQITLTDRHRLFGRPKESGR